jgi:hypothetical protein
METERTTVVVSFRISMESSNELDALVKQLGLEDRKDRFNVMFSLTQWAADKSSEGKKIASIDEQAGSMTELDMACLTHARLNSVIKTLREQAR